jgi:CheY-like chemotaxis protein
VAGGAILVVDDDRTVLRSLERILVADGYDVTCCSTARSALERITEAPPDVILLDLMMPAMNGREFLAALRDELDHGDIPVLVITGVRGIDIKQAVSMGASDVIEKPFELDELLNKIALVLFRRQMDRDRELRTEAEPGRAPTQTHTPDAPGRERGRERESSVILLSADAALADRLATWLQRRGQRLVVLLRAREELGRVACVLEPRAVLVDRRLPGAGGMRALERLRREPRLDHVPMVLVCGRDAGAIDGRRLGLPFATLCQPFSDDELARALGAATLRP